MAGSQFLTIRFDGTAVLSFDVAVRAAEEPLIPSYEGVATMRAKPIPETHLSVAPYLIVESADRAIDFYKTSFGAIELVRLIDGSGKVQHAELLIGSARLMLADEFPEMGYRSRKRSVEHRSSSERACRFRP